MVDTLGLALGLGMALTLVGLHFFKGTSKPVPEDIAQEVLERRASTVPETDFPEPYNRSIGGGGGAGAVAGAGAEGELEESEEADEGFDPESIPEDDVEYYEIEFVKEGETIEVGNNENLPRRGRGGGLGPPVRLPAGPVSLLWWPRRQRRRRQRVHPPLQQRDARRRRDREGYMLTCTAYPHPGVLLETDETP